MPLGKPLAQQAPSHGPRRGISEMYKSPRVEDALNFIDDLHLALPAQPLNSQGQPLQPQLPSDITRLTSEQLGRLYGEFVAVASYAEAHLGLSDIVHVETEYQGDVTEATWGLQTDGANKDERTYALKTNHKVRTARETALVKRARKVLLSKLITGYERAINALSREMSRRGMDLANER